MTEFYLFAGEHPLLTFFLVCLLVLLVEVLLTRLFIVVNRFFRMTMVSIRGWPPSHLDADGDWKPEDDK